MRIDNKPIYYKNWYKVGINFQNDPLDENFHFLTFYAFKEKFSVKLISSCTEALEVQPQNEINLCLLSGSDKRCKRLK